MSRLAGLYLSHLESTAEERRPRYAEQTRQHLRDYLLAHFDRVDQLTRESWDRALREARQSKTRMDRPPSWATLQRVTVSVRRCLAWCEEEGLIFDVPRLRAPAQRLANREQTPRRALTVSERDRILAEMRGEARRWYVVAFYSAMRAGEIRALTRNWIDFGRATITIPAQSEKAGQGRVIDLHPLAARALKLQLRARGDVARDAPVFREAEHRRTWRAAVAAASVDPIGLTPHHTARHTRLTQIAETGGRGALLAVMAQAGHAQVATSQRYLHAALEHARRANRRAR